MGGSCGRREPVQASADPRYVCVAGHTLTSGLCTKVRSKHRSNRGIRVAGSSPVHFVDDILDHKRRSSRSRHYRACRLKDLPPRAVTGGVCRRRCKRGRRGLICLGDGAVSTNRLRGRLHRVGIEGEVLTHRSSNDAASRHGANSHADSSRRGVRESRQAISIQAQLGALSCYPSQPEARARSRDVAAQSVIEQLHDPAVVGRHGGDADEVAEQLAEGHGIRRDAAAAVPWELELDGRSGWRSHHEVQLAPRQRRTRDLDAKSVRIYAVFLQDQRRREAQCVLSQEVSASLLTVLSKSLGYRDPDVRPLHGAHGSIVLRRGTGTHCHAAVRAAELSADSRGRPSRKHAAPSWDDGAQVLRALGASGARADAAARRMTGVSPTPGEVHRAQRLQPGPNPPMAWRRYDSLYPVAPDLPPWGPYDVPSGPYLHGSRRRYAVGDLLPTDIISNMPGAEDFRQMCFATTSHRDALDWAYRRGIRHGGDTLYVYEVEMEDPEVDINMHRPGSLGPVTSVMSPRGRVVRVVDSVLVAEYNGPRPL